VIASHSARFGDGGRGESAVALPRGKMIGGSSATSYAFAMRAGPADHDEWPQLGLDG